MFREKDSETGNVLELTMTEWNTFDDLLNDLMYLARLGGSLDATRENNPDLAYHIDIAREKLTLQVKRMIQQAKNRAK